MAMLHPDDTSFSLSDPLPVDLLNSRFLDKLSLPVKSVTSPSSVTGQYHKIYFVSLAHPGSSETEGMSDLTSRWAGREVLLRLARPAFDRIKVENEVACIEAARRVGVKIPEVLFWSADREKGGLGFEYIAMERIMYPSLEDVWETLSLAALDRVLEQVVDIFVKMFEFPLSDGGWFGGLHLAKDGSLASGPLVEETMWQLPDISRYFHSPPYNLTFETFDSLNPTGPFQSYPAYVAAFLRSYHRVISIHPSLSFLIHLLPRLDNLCLLLEDQANQPLWLIQLRKVPGRWRHGDLHFGNLLVNATTGEIKAVIDWEFAGVGPAFHRSFSPLESLLSSLPPSSSSRSRSPHHSHILSTWPTLFSSLLHTRSPSTFAAYTRESTTLDAIPEGKALKDVREYLRSCIEVGVRGWGTNVGRAKSEWVGVVEEALGRMGC